MSFTTVPTVSNGDSWSAAQHNTYLRDNMSALFPYTTAGDMAYASSSSALSRLAKPSVDSVLKNTSTGTPSWLALTQLTGILHDIEIADFNPGGQAFSSTSWADITGATVTLTLAVTCTIVVLAEVTGYNPTTGQAFYYRSMVNGVADAASTFPFNGGSTTAARNEALGYVYKVGSIAAGSRVVKLQCRNDGSTNYVERGRLIAAAFVE